MLRTAVWGLVWTLSVALPNDAAAQFVKCVGPRGDVTYSDRPCDVGHRASGVYVDPGAASFDGRAYLREGRVREAEARRQASVRRPESSSPSSNSTSSYERDLRIRELQVDLNSPSMSKEGRRAAEAELSRLNRGVAQQRSGDDEREMRNLRVDLNSIDKNTRQAAERSMEQLNDRYESPEHIRVREARRAAEAADAQRRRELARSNVSNANQLRNRPGDPTGAYSLDGTRWSRVAGGYVNSQTGQFVSGEALR